MTPYGWSQRLRQGCSTESEQAKAGLLRGQIAFLATRSGDAAALLLKAAEQLRQVDPELARETYLEALTAAIFAGPLAGPGASPRRDSRSGEFGTAGAETDAGQTCCSTVWLPFSATTMAMPREPCVRRSAPLKARSHRLSSCAGCGARPSQHSIFGMTKVGSGWQTYTFGWSARPERSASCRSPSATEARCTSSPGSWHWPHLYQEALQEATELTGSPLAPYHGVSLAAMRGREVEARQLFDTARTELIGRGEGAGLSFVDRAESVLYNGLGRYAEALAAARRVVGHTQLVTSNWAMPELIEAAVRVGAFELAAETDRHLTDRSRASGTEWALGIAARSHALLRMTSTPIASTSKPSNGSARTRVAVDLARAHLLYGEWLRRQRHRLDARQRVADRSRDVHGLWNGGVCRASTG